MLRFRKIVIACTLSLSLVLSGATAFAESMEDTVGLPSEVSINKLVSLGVFAGSNGQFNPDADLTRGQLAMVLTRFMNLSTPKSVKINDVSTNDAAYASIAKAVGAGLMKVDGKGNFNASKGATYADLSRVLASGLGLKPSWTDRPIDFLFYLDRKGVLDIDTDLDAVVSRGDAAVAIDTYLTLKNHFNGDQGVVAQTNPDSIVINNGAENVTYKIPANAGLYMSGQNADLPEFGPGTRVEVLFKSNGEVGFMSGVGLSAEEGTIVYKEGQVSVNEALHNIDLNAVLVPFPNRPTEAIALSNFGGYSAAGVTFGGTVYLNNANDEVTYLELYMAKAEGVTFKAADSTIEIDFSQSAQDNQSFSVAGDAKISMASAPDKAVTLAELRTLQATNTLTGTIEANAEGIVTSISVTAKPIEAAE